ncbi:MAG TPA: copper resistance CopC family protein [Pilimelia sp.]|nr:copper resistance CopC family protein [Pilimelia sp.]
MGARVCRLALAVLVAAPLAVAGPAAPAAAHNTLTSSEPRNGATVARPPSTVRLVFLSRLDPGATEVAVTGPGGDTVTQGAPVVSRNTVTVRLRPGPAGRYTVSYRVPSGDGHPVTGRIRFTAAGDAVATTAPASATPAPATPSPVADPAATADPDAAPPEPSPAASDGGGAGPWLWVAWPVVALLGLGAGAVALLRRRRRS